MIKKYKIEWFINYKAGHTIVIFNGGSFGGLHKLYGIYPYDLAINEIYKKINESRLIC